MSGKRIILPLFFGTLVYCIISVTLGPAGIIPMKRLVEEKKRIADNLSRLEGIHLELDTTFKNLSSDPDTIAVYAHELGYVAEGERLIKLADFTGGIDRNFSPGVPLKTNRPTTVPEWVCKSIGILAALLSFLLLSRVFPEVNHDSIKGRTHFRAYNGGFSS